MNDDLRRWMRLCESNESTPSGEWVHAYRGVPANANRLDTRFGAFFSNSRLVAASYAGRSGAVIEALIDLSAALNWTPKVAEAFQRYVIEWRQEGSLPPSAKSALARYNRTWGVRITMDAAIGQLLREHPNRLGHHEIDPLMGFLIPFAAERGCDVVIRPHEEGGGITDGTQEYIVFSAKRVRSIDE